jgi:hypothetical protein
MLVGLLMSESQVMTVIVNGKPVIMMLFHFMYVNVEYSLMRHFHGFTGDLPGSARDIAWFIGCLVTPYVNLILTPWSRVLFEMQITAQLAKKFPTFYAMFMRPTTGQDLEQLNPVHTLNTQFPYKSSLKSHNLKNHLYAPV